MLPTAYEFHWDLGHIAFLGIFYGVVTTVFAGLGCAATQWYRDLRRRRAAAIEWEETFHDLPAERRHCRHEFDGTFENRICEHGFDCATCDRHQQLMAEATPPPAMGQASLDSCLHHRGHLWVQPDPDGTLTVGMDDFASRCFGQPDHMILPRSGQDLLAGERAVIMERGKLNARLAAPVSGKVVEVAEGGEPWLYRIIPSGVTGERENLLQGPEADVWLLREREWLQQTLNPARGSVLLADGGTVMDDLVTAYPRADWDGIWGQVCLDT